MVVKNSVAVALVGAVFCALLVLTGCVTDPDPAAEAAEKLAAEINAIKAGSATVSGATVTLIGGPVEFNGDYYVWPGAVGIKNGLTVPEGVTLDVTADGAALELRNSTLTVNGTVNAAGHGDHGTGWVEGSIRTYDGTATIDGTGTIYLKSKGRLLNIGGDKGKRQLTLDGVTLVGLPDNDSPLVEISQNGEFILKSGAITGNTCYRGGLG
jgi:hypothetical protein